MVATYRHFAVEPLADGVWAAIHRMDPPSPDGWAISNAGIVDLGGRTLVFDTPISTRAAAELRGAAEDLTGRPPDIVVYSHAHNDHVWGGTAFAGATVVASARARADLLVEGPPEIESYRESLPGRLAFWEEAATSDDEIARHDAPFFLPYWQALADTLPTLELRIPDIGFEGRLWMHGRDRRVELVSTARAHSVGDAFMILPDERIAFCGDLLFVGCHPFLGDGDVEGLRTALGLLAGSGADRFVPGHGPVAAVDRVGTMSDYVDDVQRLAAAPAIASIPEAYRSWSFARFFAANVDFCAGGGRQEEPAVESASG